MCIFPYGLVDEQFDLFLSLNGRIGVQGNGNSVAHAAAFYHRHGRCKFCKFSFDIFNHVFLINYK